jgi:hypothetical protein
MPQIALKDSRSWMPKSGAIRNSVLTPDSHVVAPKMPQTECLGFDAQYPLAPLVHVEACRDHRDLHRESS